MRRVFTHLASGRQRVLAMAIKTRIVPLWSRQNKTTKVSNAAASSPSLPSCQHASHKPQRRVLPSLRQWRKRSTGKTDHTTATCTVTLPAHFVSPLIRDNALASKVGSPCPKFPRSASCGCDSGQAGSGSQSRVWVRMLALCAGRLPFGMHATSKGSIPRGSPSSPTRATTLHHCTSRCTAPRHPPRRLVSAGYQTTMTMNGSQMPSAQLPPSALPRSALHHSSRRKSRPPSTA